MQQIEWTQIIVALITSGAVLWGGRWAWNKLPKSEEGNNTLASIEAAQAAVKLMKEVNDERLAQLEERVDRLEQILEEKEGLIKKLELEIKQLLRWIQALIEQVTSLGQEPVTLDEIEWRHDDGN